MRVSEEVKQEQNNQQKDISPLTAGTGDQCSIDNQDAE